MQRMCTNIFCIIREFEKFKPINNIIAQTSDFILPMPCAHVCPIKEWSKYNVVYIQWLFPLLTVAIVRSEWVAAWNPRSR